MKEVHRVVIVEMGHVNRESALGTNSKLITSTLNVDLTIDRFDVYRVK